MIEEELKNIWRNSSQEEQIKFDLSRLLIELNRKMDNIEKNIRKRDKREIIASIIGIPIFGYLAYEIPFPITKMACILAIFIFLYVIYRLKNIEKIHPADPSLSFKTQIENQKVYFKKQAKLLDSVLYWYVLPPFIMNIIFIVGLGDPAAYNWSPSLLELLPITPHDKIKTIIGLAVFYGIIVWINKSAARNRYKPAIKEIEEVQKQLEAE